MAETKTETKTDTKTINMDAIRDEAAAAEPADGKTRKKKAHTPSSLAQAQIDQWHEAGFILPGPQAHALALPVWNAARAAVRALETVIAVAEVARLEAQLAEARARVPPAAPEAES